MSVVNDSRLNPFPHYARMQAASPVVFDQERNIWHVYNYKDVQAIMADHAAFSTKLYDNEPADQSLFTLDPPRHTQQRKKIARSFNAHTVANLETYIRTVAHTLIDQVIETGSIDLIADFAAPLPIAVIAELVGAPTQDSALFKRWSEITVLFAETMVRGHEPESWIVEARREFNRYMEALVEQRKREPRDDLVSSLAADDEECAAMTPAEIVGICRAFMAAGHESTTHLIGNAIWTLLEHPESLARLLTQPELLPAAIEEVLRYRSPAQFGGRIARADMQFGEHLIRAGQRVIFFNGAANRDPAVFSEPHRFDITRTPNRHLAFGYGIHMCVGAMLARTEARIALGVLLERLRDMRFDDAKVLESLASSMVFGVAKLPLRFTPGARHVG